MGNRYKSGECFLAFVNYDDKKGGKKRPVVIIHDREENQFFACKITSQIENSLNRKYGYVLEDWKEAGLSKPSIVKCNKKDMYKIKKPIRLLKKIGNLSTRDLEGLLVKQVKVRFLEYKKQLSSKRSLEAQKERNRKEYER